MSSEGFAAFILLLFTLASPAVIISLRCVIILLVAELQVRMHQLYLTLTFMQNNPLNAGEFVQSHKQRCKTDLQSPKLQQRYSPQCRDFLTGVLLFPFLQVYNRGGLRISLP